MVLITASCTLSRTSVHSSSGTLSDPIPWIYSSFPLYNHRIWFRSYLNGLVVFPTVFNLSQFGNKEFINWATVRSWSCFCWLYRASPSLAAKLLQLCLTLWDPRDGSPPGSPVPGILQARTLEWVAISFSNAWKWKVKSESEVAQLCPTLSNPIDCSLPGSSVHGIFQARALEWVAFVFGYKEYNQLFQYWPSGDIHV